MCSSGVFKKQQRLLKNMGAHNVMLDLLQVSYDKVRDRGTNEYHHSSEQQATETTGKFSNVFLFTC